MAWSSPISVPVAGIVGKAAGDIVSQLLNDQHWLARRLASAAAEATAAYMAGAVVNVLAADAVAPVTVTPLQAITQGLGRGITDESLVPHLTHPETFQRLFGPA